MKKDTEEKDKNNTAEERMQEVKEAAPEKEIQNLHSQILRLKAEFDNYRKRAEKEKESKYNYGKQTVLLKIIGLIDIFENAVKHTEDSENIKDIKNGLKLIHKEFMSFISKEGVKPIVTIGTEFNPEYHEIVGFEENNKEDENIILHEAQSGFICDGEVIRPAKVIVSKKKEEKEESKS